MMDQIKESLMFYGGSYDWVKNDIKNLSEEVIRKMDDAKVPHTDYNIDLAAFLVIDKRF